MLEVNDGVVSAAVKQQCQKLAQRGNTDICDACPRDGSKTTALATSKKAKVKDVRLPRSLEPLYYDLELQPFMYSGNVDEFSFRGYVSIVLDCREATNNVTLQANKLMIIDGTVTFSALSSTTSSVPAVTSWELDEERQFLVIHLDEEMKVGEKYVAALNFTGPLKDDLHGLYLSSYVRGDKPVTDQGIDWVADVFETTPKMSTYLLAFVISDFVNLNATTSNNITYRVWARPESIGQAHYALEVGVKVLTFFEDYYKIPYPLPKQDMIAIPDFSAGAMENWGLITYRETAMLYQPGVSSEGDKQRVAVIVSHELAHQWFGDLVTPSWWDDLWLNEGFASYMEYVGVDFVHPDWKMFEQFVAEDLHNVFDFDGLVTSHPIYVPVYHPDEINEIFDRISYGKGACVIAMMKHFLGPNTFTKALTNYLRERKYDAAFHNDLWAAMTKQSQMDGKNLDVKAIMDTWTLQMNYPIVTLTQIDKDNVKVTQSRYLQDPSAIDPGKYESPYDYKWDVPVTLTSSVERHFNQTHGHVHWLWKSAEEATIYLAGQLPDVSDDKGWIMGNLGQHGYYRVSYDHRNWKALCAQLSTDHQVIPPINRAQIINDAWSLAKGSYLPMEIALQTVEYLQNEMDYLPWDVATSELSYVDTMLSRTGLYGDFEKFMTSKIQAPFSKVGMNNTGATHLQSYMRSLLSSKACYYDDSSCLDNATTLFRQWMADPAKNPVDAGLKGTVYCTAIRQGGLEEWTFAYQQYKLAQVAAEEARLLTAMACSSHIWILSRYLELSMMHSEIRKQDALKVISSIARNKIGRSLAWDFFRANWPTIHSEHGGSFFALSNLIGSVTSSFNTEFDLQQLNDFMAQNPNQGSGNRAFLQAVEKARSNIAWMEQHYSTLKNWLGKLSL
ncbi:hypothetical protein V1264_005581 [Littorina saxatilis]|uniref:Aminopeptidase n=1 Tax=Littorina saxatilis TaxID=31220 RepID=A0AAN9B044_9CAEN